MEVETFSRDGGIGEHTLPPYTTTAKIITRLQNKYHPELSGNPAVWKSDNQGFKEATFIQMGRRAETQRGTEKWSGTERQWKGQPHIHLWIITRKDTLGTRNASRRPDCPVQGSRAGKINPRNFWL